MAGVHFGFLADPNAAWNRCMSGSFALISHAQEDASCRLIRHCYIPNGDVIHAHNAVSMGSSIQFLGELGAHIHTLPSGRLRFHFPQPLPPL